MDDDVRVFLSKAMETLEIDFIMNVSNHCHGWKKRTLTTNVTFTTIQRDFQCLLKVKEGERITSEHGPRLTYT